VLLIIACALLDHGSGRYSLEAGLYAAAVSVYSAALVFYPARSGRPGLAALVFAVAGWTGSALGIGLAQELDRVPTGLIAASGVLIAAMFIVRHRGRHRPSAPV